MIGLDTNVLVRLLTNDDPAQATRARRLIAKAEADAEPVFVSQLVILETEWVLRSRYGFGRDAIRDALAALLEVRELNIEDESTIEEALFQWEQGSAGFADCLISAHHRASGCRGTYTFDSKAAKLEGFIAA